MYEVINGDIEHPAGYQVATFDLTDFGSAAAFQDVLNELDIDESDVVTETTTNTVVWHNDSLAICTKNNPVTGEDPRGKRLGEKEGYASYITIHGNSESVREAYRLIKEQANVDGNYDFGSEVV